MIITKNNFLYWEVVADYLEPLDCSGIYTKEINKRNKNPRKFNFKDIKIT